MCMFSYHSNDSKGKKWHEINSGNDSRAAVKCYFQRLRRRHSLLSFRESKSFIQGNLSFDSWSAWLQVAADKWAFAALWDSLWESVKITWVQICIFTCLQGPHLNSPLLHSAFLGQLEWLFLAHLVLKVWKKCVSVLDNTSALFFFLPWAPNRFIN